MTYFYKCRECGKIIGFGNAGKGCISIIKVYGECCYDIKREAKEINDWRDSKDLDEQKLTDNTEGANK